jgi:hypothetical protein
METGMRHWGIAVLAAVLFVCPWTASADQFGDFEYTPDGESVTITYYTGAGGDVVIPHTIEGLPVRAIGDSAFLYLESLVSVTIPTVVKCG